MSMNYKELLQRASEEEATRYVKGIQIMNDLAGSLQRQGELPERFSKLELIASLVEARPVVKAPEAPIEIKRFSQEALDFLKRKEQLVYPFNELSLKAQKLGGRPFWHIVDVGEMFFTLPSMSSQVAINPSPDKFFLPKSNKLTLSQQQEMIEEYSNKLQIEFGSKEIKAVMGDVPDYSLLAFLHLDATTGKERLFGKKYGYNCARTKTQTSGSRVAAVGDFHADRGLHISSWFRGFGADHLHAAPLVVPV